MLSAQTTQKRFKLAVRTIQNNDKLVYGFILCITGIFAISEVHEIWEKETIYNGYDNTVSKTILPNCSYDSFPYNRSSINWYLVCVSYLTFDNARIIPFLISVGLIPMTFLFIRKISDNMTASLASSALVLTPVFTIFDSTSAYAQTWALFFIASLYFTQKNGYVSTALYVLALGSKAIPVFWLPIMFYMIKKSNLPKKQKIISAAIMSFFVAAATILALANGGSPVYGGFPWKLPITLDSFSTGLTLLWTSFRWNEYLLFSVPVLFSVWFYFRKKFKFDSTPIILALSAIITIFVITSFTVEASFPYRIIPNVIMILYACAFFIRNVLMRMHEI